MTKHLMQQGRCRLDATCVAKDCIYATIGTEDGIIFGSRFPHYILLGDFTRRIYSLAITTAAGLAASHLHGIRKCVVVCSFN